jgi:8-oxo-dGTP pyrophosphatase MutT (NUDIX family)
MLIGAGFILRNNLGQILLVCDARSSRWGFPKGHPEKIDLGQPLNTAVRETWEETGLRAFTDYTVDNTKPRRIGKRLYFSGVCNMTSFPATTATPEEISGIRWWNVEEFANNEAILNSDLRCWIKKFRYRSPALGPTRSPSFGPAPAPLI